MEQNKRTDYTGQQIMAAEHKSNLPQFQPKNAHCCHLYVQVTVHRNKLRIK
jgi:hypothetical protein